VATVDAEATIGLECHARLCADLTPPVYYPEFDHSNTMNNLMD
jgi:hypothetical protein